MKDNIFKKTARTIKDKTNQILLDRNIESYFNNKNIKFTLYKKDSILFNTLYGYIENNKLIVLNNYNIPNGSIIVNECNKKTYYVIKTETSNIDIVYNNQTYNKPSTIIQIDGNVEEVNVVKAGKKYYKVKY